jgi:hypothetical protein
MGEILNKILSAFDQSRYRWRTASAIAKDTALPVNEVTDALELSPAIIKAPKKNRRGENLFARKDPGAETMRKNAQPKRAAGTKRNRSRYLVLTPADPSGRHLQLVVRHLIEKAGGEAVAFDEMRTGAVWVDEIARLIRSSDAVIADVTTGNQNVMFELGLAHGLGKPVVLLLNQEAKYKLPSDLLGYQYVTYASDDLSSFSSRLERAVRQVAARRGNL